MALYWIYELNVIKLAIISSNVYFIKFIRDENDDIFSEDFDHDSLFGDFSPGWSRMPYPRMQGRLGIGFGMRLGMGRRRSRRWPMRDYWPMMSAGHPRLVVCNTKLFVPRHWRGLDFIFCSTFAENYSLILVNLISDSILANLSDEIL